MNIFHYNTGVLYLYGEGQAMERLGSRAVTLDGRHAGEVCSQAPQGGERSPGMEEGERMEALVRVGTFLGVLTAMLLWEGFRPRRSLVRPRQERWCTNLGLTLLNTVLVRVTVSGVAYTAAVFAADQGVGLLHWRPLPAWAAAAVTLLVLDFAIYLQHILFHTVPVLWR